jgi:hypothetical protein
MKKDQFTKLIQIATGREFYIQTQDEELVNEKDYFIVRKLPATGRLISFKWTAPTAEEKYLRSFITAFTTRYREPDPAAYDRDDLYGARKWNDKTPEEQEFAYYHHASNMYNKKQLMDQVEANFNNPDITTGLKRYGFYATEYGVGTFILFATRYVEQSIFDMSEYLKSQGIAFSNEYSNARWVLRFKINATKAIHESILNSFSAPVIVGHIPAGYTKSEHPETPSGYLTRAQVKAYNTPEMIAARRAATPTQQINLF